MRAFLSGSRIVLGLVVRSRFLFESEFENEEEDGGFILKPRFGEI